MTNLTEKERNLVRATIHLWNVNAKDGFVPDFHLVDPSFNLMPGIMREIRDVVQEVRPRKI